MSIADCDNNIANCNILQKANLPSRKYFVSDAKLGWFAGECHAL